VCMRAGYCQRCSSSPDEGMMMGMESQAACSTQKPHQLSLRPEHHRLL